MESSRFSESEAGPKANWFRPRSEELRLLDEWVLAGSTDAAANIVAKALNRDKYTTRAEILTNWIWSVEKSLRDERRRGDASGQLHS
jgi:hypothetical protein